MNKPVKEDPKLTGITMSDSKSAEISVHLVAKIGDDGRLVLEGYDAGSMVEALWGDSDYEYWLTVDKKYKDTILLHLIKERFADDPEFRDWLIGKGIPHQFESWV